LDGGERSMKEKEKRNRKKIEIDRKIPWDEKP